jgi:signal transduction histidine kinase
MFGPGLKLPRFARGLSARLLVLTIFFVMLGEILIYVPSISRFRLTYLQERIDAAHLAALALKATPDNMVSKDLALELLNGAQVRVITLKRPESRELMLTEPMPPKIDAHYDLRNPSAMALISDAFMTLFEGDRTIRVTDSFPDGSPGSLDVLLDESRLREAMVGYSINILTLSIVISLITASLVFLSLHILIVRPMGRITASMVSFRRAPEDDKVVIDETARGDEIGTAQRELRRMQEELRGALKQRARLAALGAAVSRINHDMRNMLSTAQLISDSLASVEDPKVRRVVPRLMQTVDRAIDLCTQTLSYGRADEEPPRRTTFKLAELQDEVAATVGLPADGSIVWRCKVPRDLCIEADREQVFRILTNLARNAVAAMPEGGGITVEAERSGERIVILFSDTGPGLPEKARAHLFEPFAGSVRQGGTGLGLAISRELACGHGGDLMLVKSDSDGTVFRLELPAAAG